MATASRSKRSRDDGGASAEPPQPEETILEALSGGRDLRRNGKELSRVDNALFTGCTELADGSIGYLLTAADQLATFLPRDLTRESGNNLLIDWSFIKLLPPAWYRIVFPLTATPGSYQAVSEAKLALDSYPTASRSPIDTERVAGFSSQKDLRLLLYPNALRFFHLGLHEPLRSEGVWPTARQVMERGYVLPPEVRATVGARLDAVAPLGEVWCAAFRERLQSRYWPAHSHQPSHAPAASATPATPATALAEEPLIDLVARVGATIDHSNADPAAAFRAALERTGRFPPDQLDRAVARMDDHQCECEGGCGRWGYVAQEGYYMKRNYSYHRLCPCGRGLRFDEWVVGDLCAGCGEDPAHKDLLCHACGHNLTTEFVDSRSAELAAKSRLSSMEYELAVDWVRAHLRMAVSCDRCWGSSRDESEDYRQPFERLETDSLYETTGARFRHPGMTR